MRNKIDSYIKAKRSEMIEDILELIRIKKHQRVRSGEHRGAEPVSAEGRSHGV